MERIKTVGIVALLVLASPAWADSESDGCDHFGAAAAPGKAVEVTPEAERDAKYWVKLGRDAIRKMQETQASGKRAKNVILFIGDGMGVSTCTAARILEGQLNGQPGEENYLSFEEFPNVALSKVYNTNQQTPDSAGTMTAMVTGVKTKAGVIGVGPGVIRGNYQSVAGNRLQTLLDISEKKGRSTGIVSTARITHATPAACYAKSPERNWEDDGDLPPEAIKADFPDIARQLVEYSIGNGIEVAMGGGRRHFLPNTMDDPEDDGAKGNREDGRNLAEEWASRPNASWIWNKAQFDSINVDETSHLLGLFERSHVEYEFDRPGDTGGEPSLTEMTEKAIQILSKNEEGFFLMVESGRIDHAHHAGNAWRALTDTIEFSNAIEKATEMLNLEETLVIVTADHSHVFTLAGYPTRGNPILGMVKGNDAMGFPSPDFSRDRLGLPYTTVGYANGPGYTGASNEQPEGAKVYPHFGSGYVGITQGRPDLMGPPYNPESHLQESIVPLSSETHSSEDVGIYSVGPRSNFIDGVQEQNVMFYVMKKALK